MALYQPLTLLDLVVYHRENASIMRIKEVRCFYGYQWLNRDMRKSSIAMFINEIINKCIKEESHAAELCEFLVRSMMTLDQLGDRVENFHLTFLIQLSRYLGFGPQNISEVLGGRLVSIQEELILKELLDSDQFFLKSIPYASRKNLLDALIRFYSSHIDGFGDARSVQVLHEVLS